MISDAHALEALEELRDQVNASVSTDLLKQVLKIETEHMFSDKQDVALRQVDAAVDAYLETGAES